MKQPEIELVDGGVRVTVWRRDVVSGNIGDTTTQTTTQNLTQGSETGSVKTSKSSETGSETPIKGSGKSSERILRIIKDNSSVTIAELANAIGISSRAIEKQIRTLRESGRLMRVGGDFGGHWQIIE